MKQSRRRVTIEAATRPGWPWLGIGQSLGVAGMLVAAYFRASGTAIVLAVGLLIATAILSKTQLHMRALDWALLAVGIYEIGSLFVTSYPANSIWYFATVTLAVMMYFVVRLATRSEWQAIAIAGLVGVGGAWLAGTAVVGFVSNVAALRAVGLGGIVAFRARLITPAGYVLGEWLTVLLLTLPFALLVPLWGWVGGRKNAAVAACPLVVVIVAGLCLSCSRAVFWSLVLFCVLAPGLATIYRLLPVWVGLAALGVVGLTVSVENAVYPGIAEAYVGGHSSQVRSTEGRIAIWKRSVDLFRQHPVWGVGAGNSPLYLNSSGDQDETVGFASRAFSLPFQLLTEKGIVGGVTLWSCFFFSRRGDASQARPDRMLFVCRVGCGARS